MSENLNESWMKHAMSASLKRLLEESGRNMADMSRVLGISFTTISDWVHGRKYPRPENLERLANYFGITTSMLLNLDDPTTHPAAQYLGLDLVRGLLVKGYTINLQFSGGAFDFADLVAGSAAPEEKYLITDSRSLDSWVLPGDKLRLYVGNTDGLIKDLLVKEKAHDTIINVEGLPGDKRWLIEYVMSLTDEEAKQLRGVVDFVRSQRG